MSSRRERQAARAEAKYSIAAPVQAALTLDRDVRAELKEALKPAPLTENGKVSAVKTLDSFQNLAANLGIGTNNISSAGSYGFNPITRIRTQLEWIHRGSWVGGVAIDMPADDMTKAGVKILGTIDPQSAKRIQQRITEMGFWASIGDVIRFSRLYGGAIGVHLIKGQNLSTPLRPETVGKDMYKGIAALDRWMLDPDLNDIITDYGPDMGKPKYYRVNQNAPALRGERVHYSRIIRMVGVSLPFQQAMQENLWGISILERLFDRMLAFDSATQGAAQLVYKSGLRTYKIKELRTLIAAGGDGLIGLTNQINFMSRYQTTEGVTLMDAEDEFEMGTMSLGGLSDAINALGQQLSGALEIPMVRFLGLSPGGLGSSGESELKTYYDGINQKQVRHLGPGVQLAYRLTAQSEGVKLEEDFDTEFVHLYQMTEIEKADIATKDAASVVSVEAAGIITLKKALMELQRIAATTGRFSSISQEDIDGATDELPPAPEELQLQEIEAKKATPAAKPAKGDKPGADKTGDESFNEADHPRDTDGKFGAGGSTSSSPKAGGPTSSKGLSPAPPNKEHWPAHIQALKLPPAWKDVQYSDNVDADLLAIGRDAKNRSQYVYSAKFVATQAAAKFTRVHALQKAMPAIDRELASGVASADPKTKAHADCMQLIRQMGLRPGSDEDTQAKVKAYGASTLIGQHVAVSGEEVRLKFTGKKGVALDLPVTAPALRSMLVQRASAAGAEGKLFPEIKNDSLLDYTKTLGGGKFKTKDFRTHAGTSLAQDLVDMSAKPGNEKEYKVAVTKVAKVVAEKLGNTPAVALQSYISPQVFAKWRQ